MSAHELEISKQIDKLIGLWSGWDENEEFYLSRLAPSLATNPQRGTEDERRVLHALRQLLNDEQWHNLSTLIADRRTSILNQTERERARRAAKEREKQEAARSAALRQAQENLEHLRQEELRRETEARRQMLLHKLRRRFQVDFLGARAYFLESCTAFIPAEEFEQKKLAFVKSWFTKNAPNPKTSLKPIPDDEQIAAIAAIHGHIQVVARAGSGKTTTLVNRAFFLIKHCGIEASEILLLAFNRQAALEIRRRVLALLDERAEAAIATEIDRRQRETRQQKRFKQAEIEANAVDAVAASLHISLPHVMTFHALANAIVHPAESLLSDDVEENALKLSEEVQQIIDTERKIPVFNEQIRELMLAHFRADWDRILAGHYDQSKEEFLRFRRSLPRKTLNGEYVKSYGEKLIANFLFEHDIKYKYEYNHWWNGINYRPDFTIVNNGVIVEYFGLEGDADYDERSADKRAYWANKREWTLLEFSPREIKSEEVDSFLELLKKRLVAQGIPCAKLSEDEIWSRVKGRAIDSFTRAIVDFVGKCRKQFLSPQDLEKHIDGYVPLSAVEGLFLKLAHRLYGAYLDHLPTTGAEDFDGLIIRAAAAISAGQTSFQRKSGSGDLTALHYVFIDEFQDFSELFYRLLCAIREQNKTIELFCVGDDWQAINGFAGSDLRFFQNFEEYIGDARRLYISTNYRSANAIVAVGNALMAELGRPATAHKQSNGEVFVADLNEFKPTFIEEECHAGNAITPMVLRLVNKALINDINVVMLCRRNTLPWFVNYQEQDNGNNKNLENYLEFIRSFLPKSQRERVTISTAHKYKGLEQSTVIVLDAVARSYPLIHPNWIFARILGDNVEKIVEEERRLLYVALTRAVETLVIITDGRSKSPFFEELDERHSLKAINWSDYPPILSLETHQTRLVIKIGNQTGRASTSTITIKDQLKGIGYRWQSTGWPCWAKSLPVEEFSVETLKSESWGKSADGVEVQIFDEIETLAARFLIDNGIWRCEVDNLASLLASNDSE